jgi:predicted nucleic acid-binding protein
MSTPSNLVVSNTTPLIALDACNQLDLLRSLYGSIIIPEEVERELSRGGGTALPTGLTAAHRAWIGVRSVSNPPSASLLARLDAGEAEVIILALEIGASLVLIDEKMGLKVAREEGLNAIGSVGLLLLAKKKGLLSEVKPHLQEMQSKGIRLKDSLIERAIIQAGETP